MRKLLAFALASLAAVTLQARADTYTLTFDGHTITGNLDAVPDFVLSGHLAEGNYDSNLDGTDYTLNLTFVDPTRDGTDLVIYLYGTPLNEQIQFFGDALYAPGTEANPVFLPGAYTLDYGDSSIATMTIVGATPEPNSLVFLGTGLLGIFGVARRRFLCS